METNRVRAIQLERNKNDCRGRITLEICFVFLWRLRPRRAAFVFYPTWSTRGGEKVLVSVSWVRSHTYPATFLCFCLSLTGSLSVFLCISLLVSDSHACTCWRVWMLHAIERTQLHRCVAWLAVFSICLKQPPLQDHRPWWRAVESPFGSFLFDMGLLSPDTSHPPTPPLSHPECSFETREAARRGNPSSLWPRALRLTLAPKWKNVHSTSRARWCRDLLFPQPSIEKLGEEYSAHPFVLIIHHPGACWKIIYCTRRWLTTQKRSLHACLISPPPQT